MLVFTQLQALLAFTMAKSVTLQNHLTLLRASSEFMRPACFHHTASTEWARRAHSVLVRPACVHQGQICQMALKITNIRFLGGYIYPFVHIYDYTFISVYLSRCLHLNIFTTVHLHNCVFAQLYIYTSVHFQVVEHLNV